MLNDYFYLENNIDQMLNDYAHHPATYAAIHTSSGKNGLFYSKKYCQLVA